MDERLAECTCGVWNGEQPMKKEEVTLARVVLTEDLLIVDGEVKARVVYSVDLRSWQQEQRKTRELIASMVEQYNGREAS